MRLSKFISFTACVSMLSFAFCGLVQAQNLSKDLQSLIALQGKPCGQVTAAVKQGANHYIAQCSNGKRYRVQADRSGRVDVTPL